MKKVIICSGRKPKRLGIENEFINEKVEQIERAVIEVGQDGRAASIQYEGESAVFALNTETITDEAAYSDAMNQYTYDMAVYEKTIQDINAKTEAIQEQDRTLELRLRQLDTEQDALQTEMEENEQNEIQ